MDAKGQVLAFGTSRTAINSAIDVSGYAHGVYYIGAVTNRGSEFIPIQF